MSYELKIPPAAQVIICALLMWIAATFIPSATFSLLGRQYIGIGIILIAAVIVLLAGISFKKAKTTVNPLKPDSASTLVVTGLYLYSRNPMYFAFLMLLVGWGIYLGSLAALFVLPAFVWYMTNYQIIPEENALKQRFGKSYTAYMEKVRRWI